MFVGAQSVLKILIEMLKYFIKVCTLVSMFLENLLQITFSAESLSINICKKNGVFDSIFF